MNDLLGDLLYVLFYLDDILILKTKDETTGDHLCHLWKIEPVRDDWKIQIGKCRFRSKST
jgi:hypothetical protein